MSNNETKPDMVFYYHNPTKDIKIFGNEDDTMEYLTAKFIDFCLSIGYSEDSMRKVLADLSENLDYTQYSKFTIREWANEVICENEEE